MDEGVERVLTSFTDAAKRSFGDALRSVVLFGSAAENRLRPVSDVNVLLVLRSFDPARADSLRDEVRLARAAISLRPMFVLESELPGAVELFATKFADIARRHRVLFGDDPFAGAAASRDVRVRSLRRTLLNLAMRLRERRAIVPDEELAGVLAQAASVARAAAAEYLALSDPSAPAPSPREALLVAAQHVGSADDAAALGALSTAREGGELSADAARDAFARLSKVVERLAGAVGT